MKYIIMADGAGHRWNNHLGIPKHLILINNETLLERTVRLVHKHDSTAEVIITSHDARYEIVGATRYEPLNNTLEIDRFTRELIQDNICFLYGDTLYQDRDIKTIVTTQTNSLLFFGSEISIIGVKVMNGALFQSYIDIVRNKYLNNEIKTCIGWQVYQEFAGLDPNNRSILTGKFIYTGSTFNINCPEDMEKIKLHA